MPTDDRTQGSSLSAADLIEQFRRSVAATGKLGREESKLLLAWASRVTRKITQTTAAIFSADDYIQEAALAAVAVIERADWSLSNGEIARYVVTRMQGAVLDAIRHGDPLGREARKTQRTIDAAVEQAVMNEAISFELAQRRVVKTVLSEVRSWTHRQRVLGDPVVDVSEFEPESPEDSVVAERMTTTLTCLLLELVADPFRRHIAERVLRVLEGADDDLDPESQLWLMVRLDAAEA